MPRKPGDPLPRSSKALVEEASERVTARTPEQVADLLDDPAYLVVDIRDPRELEREGMLPGAYRAPRGMLEFWVDPGSPYYKPALDDGRSLILYCGSAWRSALAAAALQDMGRDDVAHLEGGFSAWKAAGMPVEEYVPRTGH
ncbi:MAG: rhodanese-like domain-containing protein [Dermatophilaceae bacterium]|nr:rhodanese-like domain-containing protein [Intrasporangiaceae bacterium]